MSLANTVNANLAGVAPVSAPTAPAPAVAPAPVPASAAAAKKSAPAKSEKEKLRSDFVSTGTAIRASLTEDEKKNLGSKSDDLTFLFSIGDPCKKMPRAIGPNQYKDCHTVIGWAFKANVNMTIPVAPYLATAKGFFDVAEPTSREVQAGETIYLNLAETAMLLSRPEYCGEVTGDGNRVYLTATITKDNQEPRPQLRGDSGSVKANMQLAGKPTTDANGKTTGVEVFPEYEAFQPYFDRRKLVGAVRTPKDKSAAKNKTTQDVALAFGAYFNTKFKQQ